jgi:hypothetical protein
MKSWVSLFLCILALAIAPTAHGSAKRDGKTSISFHLQAEEIDNPKMIFPQQFGNQTLYFRRMPEISSNDILAFTPFLNDDGNDSYGLVLRLKPHSAKRLAAITSNSQGKRLVAMMNGHVVDVVIINAQVNDGIMVIWHGITSADLTTLDKSFPRTIDLLNKKKK